MTTKEFNDHCKREDALEAWALEEVFKRLLAGDEETVKMLKWKTYCYYRG